MLVGCLGCLINRRTNWRYDPSLKIFAIDGVSKRVSPRDKNLDDRRRNFCFVDFTTREEAQAAMKAIDGTFYRDAPLKVSMAIPKSERQRNTYGKREERTDGNFR